MRKGYAVILAGYVGWGLFPLFWALLTHVPAHEVLLHRMLWSVPVLLLLVLSSERRRRQVGAAFGSWRELKWLALSSLVICLNWGIYIWAVANQRVVEASMGYFLTPLLNVMAGVFVFHEKLSRTNVVAILFAAAGVAYYVFTTAAIPWIGLAVGISFAGYGLLRKQMATNAVPGLLVEILLLLPFTLGFIIWLHFSGQATFMNFDLNTDLLLILGGPVTILPLAFFTAGTRMLPMTTVGILFYVTPSLQFFCGIILLGEAFTFDKLVGFAGIWIGLAIFSYGLLAARNSRPAAVT
ncbi:MAG: EamA family transporter RarD [Gammaproteobacteria bacterium]|nr:EamA family transporter RarD [Gammaproteobacteria bacterium]MDH3535334.1 EamA family transporter RarD [Gammaproteobacteria bacterium]